MKLISVLSKLDAKTLQKSLLFMQSPYFNRDQDLVKAHSFIIDNIKARRTLSKRQIWDEVHPSEAFSDIKLRKMLNQLLNLTEQFFVAEDVMDNQHKFIRALSEYSERHRLIDLKNKLQKNLNEILGEDDLTSSESYYDLYTANRYAIDIENVFEKKKSAFKKGEWKAHLTVVNDLIDAAYAIEKIKLVLLQNSFLELVSEEEFTMHGTKIKEIVNNKIIKKHKLLNTYYKVFNLLINDSDKYVITNIIKYLELIVEKNKNEGLTIYHYLNNYLARQINMGKDLNSDRFLLMKFGLESNLIMINNKIDPSDYRNIVHTACRLKEYDWALAFIEQYKSQVDAAYRQSAYSFSKARIFWYSNNYEKVIQTLQNVEYEDITYNLNSKLMLITSLYELDEYEVLEATIKAFKVFLRRRRNLSKSRKENFNLFCDTLYNLQRASERSDPKRLQKAMQIVIDNPGLLSRWWLKEKISEVSILLGIETEITEPG